MGLTTELTSEQIVTNLLVSNEILKPSGVMSQVSCEHNLGKYLDFKNKQQKEVKKSYRYTFIKPDSWSF